MCGIIAIAGDKARSISDEKVGSMLACLKKRGPDDKGFERFDGCVMGQTRLSIVDLSPAGHQPMRDKARPHTIVFNGEIYGFQETRKELARRGHEFSSHSDTEVILKAYAEYGSACVDHLDGMFAFAIWDDEKKELFIARDRFGKKPMYYALADDTILAASEIKSIFASGLIKGIVDPAALDDYLRLRYIPSHRSVYSNISMLPPAHAGIYKNGKLSTWRYWDLKREASQATYGEAKEKIKKLFDEAVRKRMVADVEVGSLLSGGVDSTIVTLYAQRHSSTPIKTFSVGYDGHKNELPYSLEAAKKIGTDHRTLDVHANLVRELEEIIEYMDEPHADSSNFPQHLISELASTKVKVVLTGDGADELFMGYGWYQKKRHMPRWRLDWKLLNPFAAQQKAITLFNQRERRGLLRSGLTDSNEIAWEKKAVSAARDPIEKINDFDLKVYLPGQLLSKIDRTSMMHSVEVRSPFLDTALAEYVYSLPTKFKMSPTENKIILKDILAESFPKEFVYRKKQGFGAPIDLWLQGVDMRRLIDSVFGDDNPGWKYIDRRAARRIRDGYYRGKRRLADRLWTLVCLLLWFERHSKDHA